MRGRIKASFIGKVVAAAGLVALGDWLFWQWHAYGSGIGAFALAWVLVLVAMLPAVSRRRGAMVALGGAVLFGAVLIDDPSLLAFVLFWALLSVAALLPRYARFDHVGRWALRLLVHGVTSAVGPWLDLFRLRKRVGPLRRGEVRKLLPLLPLPLLGGAVFLALFASANPVIGDALSRIGLPNMNFELIARSVFWCILLVTVWATLRPRRVTVPFAADYYDPQITIPGVSIASVTLALITFNVLFALQNGLDLAYLWSGAPLPEGVSLADYAHRSAYPLIVTALLAGLFVLVTLRPGSDTAAVPLIRRLVVLWIVQNVFLVASSMLRTIDYIEVYSLTRLRIAALVWMVLVATGLVLIVWRMLCGRSGAWLINANALTAGIALFGCSVVDLGSVAAAWNVRHAREVGGQGAALDLCYLNELGASSLVSLAELEAVPQLKPDFRNRVIWLRAWTEVNLDARQQGGEWTWRGARRLAEVARLRGNRPNLFERTDERRACDGTPQPPEPVAPPPADPATTDAALTNEGEQ
jgi:Domain of unknown function (DUF4173)